MKNMIDPEKLAVLMQKTPASFEEMQAFLSANSTITATHLCKTLSVDPQAYFSWKNRKAKQSASKAEISDGLGVAPIGRGGKKYAADEKLKLIKEYGRTEGASRAELLRKFGLYHSDIERWQGLVEEAALLALSKRKTRVDKKSDEQVELENLRKELKGQEKTIAKLAALVVIQKKVSEILGMHGEV
jgi:hypothetical protein